MQYGTASWNTYVPEWNLITNSIPCWDGGPTMTLANPYTTFPPAFSLTGNSLLPLGCGNPCTAFDNFLSVDGLPAGCERAPGTALTGVYLGSSLDKSPKHSYEYKLFASNDICNCFYTCAVDVDGCTSVEVIVTYNNALDETNVWCNL